MMVHIPPSLPPPIPPLGGENPKQQVIDLADKVRNEVFNLMSQLEGGTPIGNLRDAFLKVADQLQQFKGLLKNAHIPEAPVLQTLIDTLQMDTKDPETMNNACTSIEGYIVDLLHKIE